MVTPVRVLIVEDSEPDAELLLRELKQAGYDPEYEIVDSTEAMVAALDEQTWDVIISDYVLPHFSGLDALRMVQEKRPDTPFIVVSGKIGDDVAIETMVAGAEDYVLKSNLARLAPAVKREIRDARRRQRADEARRQAEKALKTAYDEQEQRIAERTADLVEANRLLSTEIAERRRAENALRESEERFRLMADSSPVVLWVTDVEGGDRFVNRTFSEFFGATLEQVEGGGWQPLVHPDDAQQYVGSFMRSVREQTSFSGEARLRRADGEWRWVASYAHPRFSETGEFLGHVGITLDITERRELGDALRESEEHYRTLYDAIDEGFCIIEVIFDENEKPIDYIFLDVNPAFERQTGLSDARGKRMRELAPKHEEHWFEIYGAIALTGQSSRFENRAEQLHRWFDVHAFRFGQPEKRQVAILFDDITERKQAEMELAAARAEAERRASEFRSFIASMADGVIVLNADGDADFINETGRKILGIPQGEKVSMWLTGYKRFERDGTPIPLEEVPAYRALTFGETVTDRRFRIVTPWGRDTYLSVSASPVVDPHGQTIGVIVVFRDASERIELERQQQELYDREHNIAQILQSALVPPMSSINIEGCRAALRYEPALREAEVGGDFYDFFELSSGRTGIVIGDVAGKGLAAAVFVAAAKHAIRSYAYLFASPAEVMRLANEALCRTEAGSRMETSMLTAFFAVVDGWNGIMTYTNAGHEPPVIRHADGSVEELDGTDIALGIACGREYTESTHSLGDGDTVVMVTDGITEARPSAALLFGKGGVVKYLSENPQVALDDIPSGLLEAARAHGGGRLQDDAAIVAFVCDVELPSA